MTEEELLTKYNIIKKNNRRYYFVDLTKKSINFECSTPIYIKIEDTKIDETSWLHLIEKVCNYLFLKYPNKKEEALSFSLAWTKKAIFTQFNKTVNCLKLDNDLYVNCNHDADHSCWLIEDIISFFSLPLNEVTLLIHRPPYIEPKEVKAFYKEKREAEFKEMLINNFNFDIERANKIIHNINYYSEKYLTAITKSYNDFFLFDDLTIFDAYKSKFIEKMKETFIYNIKYYKQITRYLTYLSIFYKNITTQE